MSLHQHLDKKALAAACILSAAGALVFNAFPLFLSAFAEQFALNDEQLGLLGSTYLGGFALVALFSGIWVSRVGWKFTCGLAYVGIAAGMAGFAFAQSINHLLVAMVTLGIGSGVIFTIALGILAAAHDPDRAYGFKLTAEMLLAALLMFGITSLVIEHFTYSGFVATILLVYALTALCIGWLPKTNFLADEQKLAGAQKTSPSPATIWLAVLALLTQFATFSGLWSFMGRIGEVNGLAAEQVGTLLSLSILAGLASAMLGAYVGNRWGQLKPLIAIFLLTIATCLMLLNLHGFWPFAIAACLINALLQLSVIYQMGLVTAMDHSGRFTVMLAFILAAGGAVGPMVMGVIIEHYGLSPAFSTAILATVSALLLTLCCCQKEKPRADEAYNIS